MIDVDLYKEYITGTLDDCVKKNKRKFVLYPNGEITNIVKQVLDNVYNITPVLSLIIISMTRRTCLTLKKPYR